MIRINLLPQKKKAIPIGRDLIIGGILMALLLATGLIIYFQIKTKVKALQDQICETKRQIESSKVKIAEIDKLKKDKKDLEQKLNLIKDIKTKQRKSVAILEDIAQYLPEKVWLTSLSVKGTQVDVEGMALTANCVALFMKNLESTAKFLQVELDKITQSSSADKKIKSFKIICQLIGDSENQGKKDQEKKGQS